MQLYLVRMSSRTGDETFYKVGVTKHADATTRFAYGKTKVVDSGLPLNEIVTKVLLEKQKYLSDHPYDIEVIHSVSYKLEGDALFAEKKLLDVLKPMQCWPKKKFSGQSECFMGDGLQESIIQFMNEDSEEMNLSAPGELQYRLQALMVKERDPIKKHQIVLERCRQR